MSDIEYKIKVLVNSDRPDFRLFWIFLWGEDHSIDSDGDSYNPASRTWTWLYMSSRELKNQHFEINQVDENSLTFEVVSENEFLAKRVAFFLSKETNGNICWEDNNIYGFDFLADKLGDDFNLASALRRAYNSIWRKATLENPYPNLKNGR